LPAFFISRKKLSLQQKVCENMSKKRSFKQLLYSILKAFLAYCIVVLILIPIVEGRFNIFSIKVSVYFEEFLGHIYLLFFLILKVLYTFYVEDE